MFGTWRHWPRLKRPLAIAVLGIGMFALPAGILGSGFMDDLGQRRHRQDKRDDSDQGERADGPG